MLRPLLFALFQCCFVVALASELPLPQRPGAAPSGSQFSQKIASLDLARREQEIIAQVQQGNVPNFWRKFVEVRISREIDGRTAIVVYQVSPDYLAIGSDEDYFLAPVSPTAAQAIADQIGCILPTRRMVDDIYAAAAVKLSPSPIPPSAAMTTVPVFVQHNDTVYKQRQASFTASPLGVLVAGHKKDVVLTPRLSTAPGKVAIYGWHRLDGNAIQPLHLGHTDTWVDYSHGARFVLKKITIDGQPADIVTVLADARQCVLFSDEGPLAEPRYTRTPVVKNLATPSTKAPAPAPSTNQFNERLVTLTFDPGVRVVINSPANLDNNRTTRLILFALPNGNTIEQTIGRKIKTGDDWHFDIQHIGAQTRWLRDRTSDAQIVIAYLECAEKSWPTWRRTRDPNGKRIAEIIQAIRDELKTPVKIVLTGHSGGGSFTFGYLNSLQRIPDDVERIAFLDSNYGYDPAMDHGGKLSNWLASSTNHFMVILAYHDSIALLNGKTFVSEAGGTWGKSHAMQKDLSETFKFTKEADAEWQRFTALDGRVKFLLKENPTRAVFHTRMVEWNGFIHAMLCGTPLENKDYIYFGSRAYEKWISDR